MSYPSRLQVDIKILDARLLSRFGGAPAPATPGASAVDVVACAVYPTLPSGKPDIAGRREMSNGIEVEHNRTVYFGLGFAMAGPIGWAAMLLPRSGLASARGLVLANTVGFIDIADYRGECIAALRNTGHLAAVIHPGDRIAQMCLVNTPLPEWSFVDELPPSHRGAGGFGSTGVVNS